MSLYSQFKKQVQNQGLFPPKDKCLLALSGGLDSVVLSDLMARLAREKSLKIILVHVNYHLRGAASNLDEALVRRRAAELNFPLEVLSCRLNSKKSLQDQARKIRYEYFEKMSRKHLCTQVVLAHHLQDQIETFLMRLIQGAGLQGLKAMELESLRGDSKKLKILRPLLPFSKEELRAYALSESLKWREDASNQKKDYLRNRIRLGVLPILESLNPKVNLKIAEAIEVLQLENEWMRLSCEKILKGKYRPHSEKISLSLVFLQSQPISMRYRVYTEILTRHFSEVRIHRQYLKALDEMVMAEKKQMKLSFSKGYGACLNKKSLVFQRWRTKNLKKRGFFQ